ncbi:hypothetical protein [Cytobacillus solani]|uniref:Uncharacterized protein n=1 Tax=Cytobacillus solani TaxID=1637975 RepID=A0A0Q3SIB7_9BACI|nr:hypothetical protein [Cytobacillus solani]KOP84117.1 hypothetical protein AMS60_00270 [Bacillus sp. FJAT-21945]KQL19276.1 hypothetical protein AN957_12305 [Cytobacillus solani]
MSEKWTFNTDKDYWDFGSYDSRKEAIEQGRIVIKGEDPDYFYENSHFSVGTIVPVAMKSIDAENMILEPIAEDLYGDHEQGGVISPLLANVYLHYVLDLWFEKEG